MAKKKITITLEVDTIAELKETSDVTLIPQSRLVERAIRNELQRMNELDAPVSLPSDNT